MGAGTGDWCWQKVIPFLEAAGHAVHAPTLTGLAERAAELSPDVGLDTHIQDVVSLLEDEDLQGVLLVGHSCGGMVITGVVDQAPVRIARLIYLDTFVPRDGESMADVSPMIIGLLRRQARAQGDSWRIPSRGDYGVTKEPDRSWVLRNVTSQPLKTYEQRLHLENPAIVSTKLRTHIDCTGSGLVFSLLRQLLNGHDALITMPRQLADLLLEVVGQRTAGRYL